MNTLRVPLRDKSPRGVVQLSPVAQGQEQLSHVLSQSRSSRWLDLFQQNYKTGEHKNTAELWSQFGKGCNHLSGELFRHLFSFAAQAYTRICILKNTMQTHAHLPAQLLWNDTKHKAESSTSLAVRVSMLLGLQSFHSQDCYSASCWPCHLLSNFRTRSLQGETGKNQLKF